MRKVRINISIDVELDTIVDPKVLYHLLNAVENKAVQAAETALDYEAAVEVFGSEIECDCGAVMDEDNDTGTISCDECDGR